MQFIKSTSSGIISAYQKLSGGPNAPIIHLFPMVHIGDKEFYETVLKKISKCDIILLEGVGGAASKGLEKFYNLAERNPKLGLTFQKNIIQMDALRGEVIQADVLASDFNKKMKQMPFFVKLKLLLAMTFLGTYFRYFATRKEFCNELGAHLEAELRITQDKASRNDAAWQKAKEVILDWRDTHLIDKLNEELEKTLSGSKNIAIVYGAAHMKAVKEHLINNKRYEVDAIEWLNVIKL